MYFYLNLLISSIIQDYFEDSCVTNIYEQTGVSIENHTMILFEHNYSDINELLFNKIDRCQDFVINAINASRTFSNLEYQIKTSSIIRYERRRYIVVVNDELNDFFDTIALRFVSEVIAIKYISGESIKETSLLPSEEEGYFEIYSKGFNEQNRFSQVRLVDIWYTANRSFHHGYVLFSNIIINNIPKSLRVVAYDFIPYSHTGSVLGSETRLLVEYANTYNINLTFSAINMWGTLYPNWTGVGLFGEIVSDTYDVGLGAVFPLEKWSLYVDFSGYTAHFKITCIVPNPRDTRFMFVTVFSATLWLLICISYLCGGIIMYVINSGWFSENRYDVTDSIMVVFSASTSQAFTNVERSCRIMFIVLFILKFYVSMMYNTALSSTLVTPHYADAIATVEDLAYSDLLWGETQQNWVFPIEQDDGPVYRILTKKFQEKTMEALTELFKEGSFAFGVVRLNDGYLLGEYSNEANILDYTLMKEDIYHMYSGCVLRKNSVFIPSFDMFMSYARQGGLIDYWESLATRAYFDMNIQMALMSKEKLTTTTKLTMEHMEGAFLILIFGSAFSLLVFAIEINWTRLKNLFSSRQRRFYSGYYD